MSSRRKSSNDPIDVDFTLRRVFGKTSFRPCQREIITAALEGFDVFVQAATSFGKSLCYQLPAVIDHGITIVVSPLLALMNNQVAALREANIKVQTLNSNTPTSDRNAIIDDLRCGHPHTRLLYITPEYTLTESFRKHISTVYTQGELSRIAIDEAHCISEWGHDFRTAFTSLSYFRSTFPSVPIICLTATATAAVRQDIITTLNLDSENLKIFTTSTSRPNLHYEVRFTSDEHDCRFSYFISWLQTVYARRRNNPTRAAEIAVQNERAEAVSGIIYVSFRSECDALAARLRSHNIGAAPYHAGLSAYDRVECQRKWLANEPGWDVIVATTAFGMGIDKQDVRFVVHWNMPKSFEGFYQEAGRAGRDGKAAACVLFYSREDRDRISHRMTRDGSTGSNNTDNAHATAQAKAAQSKNRAESFQKLVNYCEGTGKCRHRFISDFFADKEPPACDFACDYCKDAEGLKRRKREGLASEEWVSTQRERSDFFEECQGYY